MRRSMSRAMGVSMVFTFLGGFYSAALAQPVLSGSLSNFDIWNWTGVTANDFEAKLTGVNSNQIYSLWKGSYPNTAVVGDTNPTIRWTGSTTQTGASAHFGITFKDCELGMLPSTVDLSWTKDGQSIGVVPATWQYWVCDPLEIYRRDIIRNSSVGSLWFQRRVLTPSVTSMDLADLMRGGPMWNDATIIDPTPVEVLGGADLIYDFQLPNRQNVWTVMMYDVTDATGQIQFTYLNAARCVPEPTTLVAMGIGLVALARRRRKA